MKMDNIKTMQPIYYILESANGVRESVLAINNIADTKQFDAYDRIMPIDPNDGFTQETFKKGANVNYAGQGYTVVAALTLHRQPELDAKNAPAFESLYQIKKSNKKIVECIDIRDK